MSDYFPVGPWQKSLTSEIVGKRYDEVRDILMGKNITYRVVKMNGFPVKQTSGISIYELQLELDTAQVVSAAYFGRP